MLCMHTYVHMCVHALVHTYVRTYMYVHTYTYSMYMCVLVCTYVCLYHKLLVASVLGTNMICLKHRFPIIYECMHVFPTNVLNGERRHAGLTCLKIRTWENTGYVHS